jgi:hypothetical protein
VLADIEDSHCEYRLAFLELSDEDEAVINQLVEDFRAATR